MDQCFFSVPVRVQSSRDPVIHDDHFRHLGNVFDPNFPSNKLRLYFCGVFGIDHKSSEEHINNISNFDSKKTYHQCCIINVFDTVCPRQLLMRSFTHYHCLFQVENCAFLLRDSEILMKMC